MGYTHYWEIDYSTAPSDAFGKTPPFTVAVDA